jgi:MFS family permease
LKDTTEQKRIWGFSPNVFFLGIVSLLTDVSSEMIFTLIPLFLANVLKASFTAIGLVGGLTEGIDAIFRMLSGWFSDKMGKRKALTVWGYSLSTVVKPFMYLASSWGAVLGIKFIDRIGKGLRSSARDALIADSVSPEERGRGFGFHRAMDTAGAFIGLVIAALIIYLVQGGGLELSLKTYQWLVLIGIIPAVLAVLVLLVFVRERKRETTSSSFTSQKTTPGKSGAFDARFKLFLAVMAVFTLGNSGTTFVILRAQNLGAPLIYVTLMLVLFNAAYVAISLPAGVLSDKLGRRRVIILGWLVYTLVYLGFALAGENWQIWLLFAGYGLYYGFVEGVARAFVADLVVAEKRGTAYGLYYGVVGISLLLAGVIGGWMWGALSPAAPFFFGAGLAFAAMLGLVVLIRE